MEIDLLIICKWQVLIMIAIIGCSPEVVGVGKVLTFSGN